MKKKNIKKKIIETFKKIVQIRELYSNKSNQTMKYRIDSYKKAIRTLEKFDFPIYSSNDIKDLPYIGKNLCYIINQIEKGEEVNIYKNIDKKFIKNIDNQSNKKIYSMELFQKIWGIGPKNASFIVKQNIYTIKDLKESVKNENIKLSNQQRIGLKYYTYLNKKIPRDEVIQFTDKVKEKMKHCNTDINIHNAGSFRLNRKYVGDIDLILSCLSCNVQKIKKIKEYFEKVLENDIKEKLIFGKSKNIYIIKNGKEYRKIDVLFIHEKYFLWYMLYFGSSREFSKKIRTIALKKGYKLNEKGLYYRDTNKRVFLKPKCEKDIFDFLKIEYIPPEKR
jgi:DNA polymerase/3'-5' exonuclease PolX